MKGAELGRQEIETLREQWRAAMTPGRFPRYKFDEHEGRFTLSVQEEPDGKREVLGRNLSLYVMCLRERNHRGWPVEAHETIAAFVEAERTRAREQGRTD